MKRFIPLIILFIFTGNATASEKINYRLKWLYNTSVVGDLYALEHHFFSQADLDVDVKAGGPERDAIREIELGHADFGVASADQVIRARAKGSPVIVIAQLFQENPLQWVYRKNNGPINNLSDLKGKRIGITYGGNDETIMRAILSKAGIDEKEIHIFSVRYDFTPFYQNRTDLWPVYKNSQGIIIEKKLKENNEAILFFNPSDYGVRFVANAVVTSEKMLTTRPDILEKFISALLSGWEAALSSENEQKALEVLKKYERDTDEGIRKEQLSETRALVLPKKGTNIGTIDIPSWKQTEAIMLRQKLISKPVKIENHLHPLGN